MVYTGSIRRSQTLSNQSELKTTDSPATLRDVFELPNAEAPERSSPGWKEFQDKIVKEIKGVKLASMPDVTKKFGELFDIPIPDIFLASWKKANAVQESVGGIAPDPGKGHDYRTR